MGFNQHTRGVWVNGLVYNIHLPDGQNRRARQQPVLADGATVGLRHGARSGHLHPPAARGPRGQAKDEHCKFAEKTWQLPEGTIPRANDKKLGKTLIHAVAMHRASSRTAR